ncbi:unnamed protein product [Amoebophrya sp. A120]|nr:unnamed protein product [Amoebophrya sp. A120]|eukprot:GSA120T00008655001.1
MWAGNEVSGSMMQVDKKKATQKSCTEEDLKKVVGRGCWCERSPDSGSGCADGGYEWMSKEQAQGDGNCLSLRERAQYGYCDHTGPYCTEKCEAR